MNKLVLSFLLGASSLVGFENNHKGYAVEISGQTHAIKPYDIDPQLRKLSVDKIKILNEKGYLKLSKYNNGDYKIDLQGKLNGGTGFVTAFIAGTVVRVGCYTGYFLAASTPVVVGSAVAGPAGATAATSAVTLAVAGAGGAAAVIASTEALAMKVQLYTLMIPFPLP